MDKYAVFGHPIQQSKSPTIHRLFAEQTKQALEYSAIDPGLDNFASGIRDFIQQGGKGANVTMPFKQQAFTIADHISERAQLAGAVNTLSFNSDGTIKADNTDGAGLVNDLKANNAPLDKRILLIGAGGAARGVVQPLLACQPQSLTIVNRTFEKAKQLAELFNNFGEVTALPIKALANEQAYDLVINSTSTSLTNELPPVPASIFMEGGFAYDMVYRDQPTCFLNWAKQYGCTQCVDGLGMLVGQAAESFNIWREVRPEQQSVLTSLRAELGAK